MEVNFNHFFACDFKLFGFAVSEILLYVTFVPPCLTSKGLFNRRSREVTWSCIGGILLFLAFEPPSPPGGRGAMSQFL